MGCGRFAVDIVDIPTYSVGPKERLSRLLDGGE